MSRTSTILFALVAILGAGLVWVANRPVPALSQGDVEAIVTQALARQAADVPPQSVAAIDAATINPMIEDYLMANPRILQRVGEALDTEIKTAEAAQRKEALQLLGPDIYDDPDHIVLGNPDGDVTLVEMFDYNCGYCRQALPDMATLIAEDPNLRIILKEFPILSQGSIDAAKIAVAVSRTDVDYWTFHQKLFTSRGQVTKETALAAAQSLGLNPLTLELDVQEQDADAVIQKSYKIAQGLNVSGTPTFIIGNEVIPGAVGLDALRERIANMRKCGATSCPA